MVILQLWAGKPPLGLVSGAPCPSRLIQIPLHHATAPDSPANRVNVHPWFSHGNFTPEYTALMTLRFVFALPPCLHARATSPLGTNSGVCVIPISYVSTVRIGQT